MLRTAPLLIALSACGGPPTPAAPPTPALPTGFAAQPARDVADPAELPMAGIRTLTAETVRRAFEPLEVRTTDEGVRCTAFKERAILTRASERGGRDLRIRPRHLDLEEDCNWDGPVLVDTRVEGEVLGVVWPHVAVFAPDPSGVGRLQIVQGTTGGVIMELIEVIGPAYVKSLTLGFSVPARIEVERAADESCEAAIERAWKKALQSLRDTGRVAQGLPDTPPSCPPDVLATCAPVIALPYELMLGKTEASPVVGPIGCIGGARRD